ncbi:MAG: DUF3566 domain-containing protein [Pseudomonadota bacterium]
MSQLVDIFLQPGKTFAELKDKPTFLLPVALATVVTVAVTALYFSSVDGDWLVDQLLSANPDATAKEIEQARKVMPGAKVMGYFAIGWGAISTVLFTALAALYFLIAGKISGNPVSFRHGMSLSAWSGMPSLLLMVVILIGVLTMDPQTQFSSLALLNVDPLFFELPMDHPWSGFAKSLSLLMPWTIFLGALGWRTWFRTGWGQAAIVSALPYVVYFGVLATLALLR